MKIEGYVEISKEEFYKLSDSEVLIARAYSEDKTHYFKKAQKFPIVFEDGMNRIEISKTGIRIISMDDDDTVGLAYGGSFPLLVKAVEKAKEITLRK